MAGINRSGSASTAPQGQSEGRNGKGQGLDRYKPATAGGWEPTVVFLLALVVLEIVGYGALRYAFRGVHGG
jgi:hypothetical protein